MQTSDRSEGLHLRLDLSLPEAGLTPPSADESPANLSAAGGFLTDADMKQRVRDNLIGALDVAGWKISGDEGAAKLLGLKPSTLTDRMRSLGIKKSDQS